MGIEVLLGIASALVSMVAGGIASSKEIQSLFRKLFNLPEPKEIPYSERLSKLTSKLEESTKEVDEIIKEISVVSQRRQATIERLEADLETLETKESALKDKISVLENTPVEAAKHFAEIISEGEKKGAKRDYMLFGAGVLVSTIVAITLQIIAS